MAESADRSIYHLLLLYGLVCRSACRVTAFYSHTSQLRQGRAQRRRGGETNYVSRCFISKKTHSSLHMSARDTTQAPTSLTLCCFLSLRPEEVFSLSLGTSPLPPKRGISLNVEKSRAEEKRGGRRIPYHSTFQRGH